MRYPTILPLLLAALLGLAGQAFAAGRCEFMPEKPKPAWVGFDRDFSRIEGDYYEGVGFGERGEQSASEQIKASRQAAIESLVTSIQVNVKTSLVQESSRRESGGVAVAESSLKSVTEATATISLKNMQTADVWLDRESCVVWTLLRVSRAVVDASRREQYSLALLDLLKQQIKVAEDLSLPPERRSGAYRQAQTLIGSIEFAALSDAPPRSYFDEQLSRLGSVIGEASEANISLRTAVRDADRLLEQARQEIDAAKRAQIQRDASQRLLALAEKYPLGVEGVFRPSEVNLRLGLLERERGNFCAAQAYLQRVLAGGAEADRAKAQGALAESTCDARQQLEEAWRKAFGNKKIALICSTQLGTTVSSWTKACDVFGAQIRNYGGTVVPQGLKKLPAPLSDAGTLDPLTRYIERAGQDGTLLVLAQGRLNRRKGENNAFGGQDYQYSGQLAAFFVTDDKLVFSDNFQATSGWNPVSEQMTMEVVALNLFNRWKGKFSDYVKQ